MVTSNFVHQFVDFLVDNWEVKSVDVNMNYEQQNLVTLTIVRFVHDLEPNQYLPESTGKLQQYLRTFKMERQINTLPTATYVFVFPKQKDNFSQLERELFEQQFYKELEEELRR